MNNPTFRLTAALLAALACHFLAPAAHAVGQARANYRNVSYSQVAPGTAAQNINPGVVSFSGYIKGSQTQTANNVVLQKCAFGQAFSQWYPFATHGRDIIGVNGVSGVKGVLYPVTTAGSTRTSIQNSGKPFRYKWLLYSGTGTDVTAFDATSIAGWFTQADRDLIADQIAVLKAAVAASPLDTSLRATLLDVYFDLAVAEMQATKPKLAELAKYHLGLQAITDPTKFIIDKEIDTYVAIDAAFVAAIAQYTALLTTAFPDIDPSSFDSRVPFGSQPMGQYIFRREQPRRNSIPSQYASGGGIQEVPQSVGGAIVTPGILFTGYKDLKALLDIVGQRPQHLASLCRLRGARQNDGDVALARESLALATDASDTDLGLIKSWFPELFPPDLNALTPAQINVVNNLQQQSGILASLAGLEAGRIELMSVTPFLNGTNNILGYDPEFLLLVEDSVPGQFRESYDVLHDMLVGANKPLTDAIVAFNAAASAYIGFQEKVDRVATDIDDAETAFADRYQAITGFEPGEDPPFKPLDPNPKAGSELLGVLDTIATLDAVAAARIPLSQELDSQLADGTKGATLGAAQAALLDADKKAQAIYKAGVKYKATTRPVYEEMISWTAGAAASQASFEAISATAAIIASGSDGNPIKGASAIGAAIVTGAVGAINVGIQTAAAKKIGVAQQDIDYAAIDFSVTTESVDAALTVNQARQEISALKRERSANVMASISDEKAKAQALAQRDGLLLELIRIQRKSDNNINDIRKKSYADPLHYHKAEAALLDADETFRTAQRWMFYTLQALNYKWNGKFAKTDGSKTYDSATLFKCRNAAELNALLSQMVQWNGVRVSQTLSSPRIYTRISLLQHILARNPERHNIAPQPTADPGTRADDTLDPPPTPLPAISTLQYFRKVLAAKYRDGAGDLTIPFSTLFGSQSVDRADGIFFRGATYNSDGSYNTLQGPGFWREKIEYVKVNIIAEDAPAVTDTYACGLTYGGTTYFHTRVPPRGDRTVGGLAIDDAPGELLVAPFRWWITPDFSQNFVPLSEQTASPAIGYSQTSQYVGGTTPDNLADTFRVFEFAGRSIAASGWKLAIPRLQHDGLTVDVDKIKDIEIIVAYKHSARVPPPP